MRTCVRHATLIAAIVVAVAAVSTTVSATMRPPVGDLGARHVIDIAEDTLAPLFDALRAARSSTEATGVEQRIWEVWMHSGDAGVDQLLSQSVTAMQSGKLQDSLALLDAVVSKAPKFAEGWNKRATVLYMVGELDRSLADIEKVLALEPRHFGAISGIGLIKVQQGDSAAALLAFKKVLEIYPLSPGALQNVDALEKRLQGDPT